MNNIQRLAISIPEAAAMISISVSGMKRLIYARDISSYRIGGRRLVQVSSVEKFLADRIEEAKNQAYKKGLETKEEWGISI